jgi:outer membrane biosynthesis protein TonB
MKVGLTISIVLHAAAMLWGLISFSAKPLEAKPTESLPVDIVSATEFTQLMAGNKTAPKAEKPKPLVEKVDEPKPAKDLNAKVDTKELEASKEEPPPPPPLAEPKVAEQKPDKKQPEPKIDPLAEQMKKEKEEAKKVAEAKPKVPTPPRRPAPPQPKFDANEITALLDKRKPQRLAATGSELNTAPTLGTTMGNSATLSQNEIDALRARLMSLWNPPAGARTPEELLVRVRIQLGRDGKLSAPPMVLTSGSSALFHAARESAVRAVFRGQPYDMLSPNTYEAWKDIEITFDPREMFRG